MIVNKILMIAISFFIMAMITNRNGDILFENLPQMNASDVANKAHVDRIFTA